MVLNIFYLIYSAFLGWMIGRERKKRDKDGGSRTFAIISLGACLASVLVKSMLDTSLSNFDSLRLIAYCLASIGFLTSGLIIKNKNNIYGLTTASSLWTLVIISYCIGLGGQFFVYGNVVAILLYLILESNKKGN